MTHTPTSETYEQLQYAFDFFNENLFDGKLKPCLITLQREKHTAGYFSKARFVKRTGDHTDEIALNPACFAIQETSEVMQTLVHEMVHLWQAHHGKSGRRKYHNKQWAQAMETIGLMPSRTGAPGGKKTGEKMSHYPIEDGPFEITCAKLLQERPDIVSWLDRIPMVCPLPPSEDQIPEEYKEKNPEKVKELLAYREKLIKKQAELKTKLNIDLPTEKPLSPNRKKYVCPICETQVWGKPGLRIACLNCKDDEEGGCIMEETLASIGSYIHN
jgi:predicted SprT family Zn-dependent metalloprotease